MNRRSFLGTLALLPGLKWLKPTPEPPISIGSIAVLNTNADEWTLTVGDAQMLTWTRVRPDLSEGEIVRFEGEWYTVGKSGHADRG